MPAPLDGKTGEDEFSLRTEDDQAILSTAETRSGEVSIYWRRNDEQLEEGGHLPDQSSRAIDSSSGSEGGFRVSSLGQGRRGR
jgi:hypothetical protein